MFKYLIISFMFAMTKMEAAGSEKISITIHTIEGKEICKCEVDRGATVQELPTDISGYTLCHEGRILGSQDPLPDGPINAVIDYNSFIIRARKETKRRFRDLGLKRFSCRPAFPWNLEYCPGQYPSRKLPENKGKCSAMMGLAKVIGSNYSYLPKLLPQEYEISEADFKTLKTCLESYAFLLGWGTTWIRSSHVLEMAKNPGLTLEELSDYYTKIREEFPFSKMPSLDQPYSAENPIFLCRTDKGLVMFGSYGSFAIISKRQKYEETTFLRHTFNEIFYDPAQIKKFAFDYLRLEFDDRLLTATVDLRPWDNLSDIHLSPEDPWAFGLFEEGGHLWTRVTSIINGRYYKLLHDGARIHDNKLLAIAVDETLAEEALKRFLFNRLPFSVHTQKFLEFDENIRRFIEETGTDFRQSPNAPKKDFTFTDVILSELLPQYMIYRLMIPGPGLASCIKAIGADEDDYFEDDRIGSDEDI